MFHTDCDTKLNKNVFKVASLDKRQQNTEELSFNRDHIF